MRQARLLATAGCILGLAAAGIAGVSQHRRPRTASDRTVVIGSAIPGYIRETDTSRHSQYVGLAGTWGRKKSWRDLSDGELSDEAVARRLAHKGTVWVLYHIGKPPIKVTSATPILVPAVEEGTEGDRGPSIHAPLLWVSGRVEDPDLSYLAVSGVGKIDRPSVRLLPADEQWVNDLVRKALRKLGRGPEFTVTQNIAVDLDGDGRPDRLVAVSLGHRPLAAMLLAMLDRGHGAVRTVVVRGPVDKVWSDTDQNVIVAVADINGDGFREIAAEVYGPDLSAYEVFAYDGKRFGTALSWLLQ